MILGQISSIPARKAFSSTAGLTISFFFYGLLCFLDLGYILVNYLLMRCLPRSLAGAAMTCFSAVALVSASFYHFQID